PTRVDAEAGGRVLLSASISGLDGSTVRWFMGSLLVVRGTLGSDAADVAAGHTDVLRWRRDGSLSLVAVPLSYSHRYSVEVDTVGVEASDFIRKEFILKVSSVQQGEVEHRKWFLEGEEIRSTSHYSLREEQLLIHQLRRGDAGRYSLQLLNPLSEVEGHLNLTVLSEGFPVPTADWLFGGKVLPGPQPGVLDLTNVGVTQGGTYTCQLRNQQSGAQRSKNITLLIYGVCTLYYHY
ncbi:hypothetical protein CRUP_033961, partial [Coryphaenoides rupestris]